MGNSTGDFARTEADRVDQRTPGRDRFADYLRKAKGIERTHVSTTERRPCARCGATGRRYRFRRVGGADAWTLACQRVCFELAEGATSPGGTEAVWERLRNELLEFMAKRARRERE